MLSNVLSNLDFLDYAQIAVIILGLYLAVYFYNSKAKPRFQRIGEAYSMVGYTASIVVSFSSFYELRFSAIFLWIITFAWSAHYIKRARRYNHKALLSTEEFYQLINHDKVVKDEADKRIGKFDYKPTPPEMTAIIEDILNKYHRNHQSDK